MREMTDRTITDQETNKSDTLARRILALIGIVIFFGLPIYGFDEDSD
jgi:hypothetical protein